MTGEGIREGEQRHTPSRGALCQYLAGGADSPRLLPAREAEMCLPIGRYIVLQSCEHGTRDSYPMGWIDLPFDIQKGCSEVMRLLIDRQSTFRR
jgi:hypothetical protein